jgi:hypothetical protein
MPPHRFTLVECVCPSSGIWSTPVYTELGSFTYLATLLLPRVCTVVVQDPHSPSDLFAAISKTLIGESWLSHLKIGLALEVPSHMLKSSRELVKFSESTHSGSKVECVQDDRRFAAVFSATGPATLENFVLRGTTL